MRWKAWIRLMRQKWHTTENVEQNFSYEISEEEDLTDSTHNPFLGLDTNMI